MKYDLVISASCYFSPLHAIRLVNSTAGADGKVLSVITCPRMEDANAIVAGLNPDVNAIVLHSVRRERHLCQDLGFLYCLNNDIQGCYLMFSDDDIEFTVSNFLDFVEDPGIGWSVMGFSSNTLHYDAFATVIRSKDYIVDPPWIDGYCMVIPWDSALQYGIFDEVPGNFNSSFVEMELAHRHYLLSKKPSLGCVPHLIHHHSRINNVEQIRDSVNQQSVIHCGYQLWEKKFGLALSAGDFNSSKMNWYQVYKLLDNPVHKLEYQRHLILDNIWLDYDVAWAKFSPGVTLIKEQYANH